MKRKEVQEKEFILDNAIYRELYDFTSQYYSNHQFIDIKETHKDFMNALDLYKTGDDLYQLLGVFIFTGKTRRQIYDRQKYVSTIIINLYKMSNIFTFLTIENPINEIFLYMGVEYRIGLGLFHIPIRTDIGQT